MDQNRLDAMKKLAELKKAAIASYRGAEAPANEAVQAIRQ
jgi:hypothetical protein